MNRRRTSSCRSYAAQSQPESVRLKLWRIVARHEQLKITFSQLKSEVKTGLLEAEDVFASLAIPLGKLVGLKTLEMATEGRYSSIVTSTDSLHFQDENYMSRATVAGNELMERQKLQLVQLINILRKIEAQVNSSQNSLLQSLADHQASIKKFFLKAVTYVSAIHQSSQSNDLSYMMMKLLKVTFDQVDVALNSVETGVDNLISELAEKMCNPMVQYVNGLKVELKEGTCSRLLEVVKEMDGAMNAWKFELEEERKQARLAEQHRIQALGKLKKSEENARKMTTSLGLLTEDTKEPEDKSTKHMALNLKEDQAKDDGLLWELLRKKRKCQVSDSPVGPKELLGIGSSNQKANSKRTPPALTHRPVTRSRSRDLTPQNRLILGSSPSATTQKVLSRKRMTP